MWLRSLLHFFHIRTFLPPFPCHWVARKYWAQSWRTCHTLNMLQSHFLNCESRGQLWFPEAYRLILWTLCIVSFGETGACIICAHTTLLLSLEPQAIAVRRSLTVFQGELKRRAVSTVQRNRSLGLCRRSAGKEQKLIVSGRQTANSICSGRGSSYHKHM